MSPEALQEAIASLELRVAGATAGLEQAEESERVAIELHQKAAQLTQEAAERLDRSQEALSGLLDLQEAQTAAEGVSGGDEQ